MEALTDSVRRALREEAILWAALKAAWGDERGSDQYAWCADQDEELKASAVRFDH